MQQSAVSLSSSINSVLTVVKPMVQYLFDSFNKTLQVNRLAQYIPQFNTEQLDSLNKECVAYFYLQGQSKSECSKINEDRMPISLSMEDYFNLHIRIGQDVRQKLDRSKQFTRSRSKELVQKDKKHHCQSQIQSLNYSMSKIQLKQQKSQVNPQNASAQTTSKTPQGKQFIQQGLIFKKDPTQPPSSPLQSNQLSNSQLVPLNIKEQKQDPQLLSELQHLKKHLYITRRFRNRNIQEEREKLDSQAKKKSPLLFRNDLEHTYQYDGTLVRLKRSKEVNSLIPQLRPNLTEKDSSARVVGKRKGNSLDSKSLDIAQKERNSLVANSTQSLLGSNPQRKISSQHLQKASYNNCNKRQVSHLPLIFMKDNTKITQNKKQLSGRNSLNRSKILSSECSQNSNFRSFAQMQQQKRLQMSRQKVLQFAQSQQQSSGIFNVDIMPPTLNLNVNESQFFRRQSRTMQKYLRKLTQQKYKFQKCKQEDQGKKSFNFQQLAVPQKYPIQRYYQYDYEGESQAYEFEMTSKLCSKRSSITGLEII